LQQRENHGVCGCSDAEGLVVTLTTFPSCSRWKPPQATHKTDPMGGCRRPRPPRRQERPERSAFPGQSAAETSSPESFIAPLPEKKPQARIGCQRASTNSAIPPGVDLFPRNLHGVPKGLTEMQMRFPARTSRQNTGTRFCVSALSALMWPTISSNPRGVYGGQTGIPPGRHDYSRPIGRYASRLVVKIRAMAVTRKLFGCPVHHHGRPLLP